jgi:ectoine hydroxylase-related dioxygenase (phytanoyl-CoA dioxygenase family)
MTMSAVRPDILPPQSIALSQQEQDDVRISASNRELAALLLSCRGYVILKDAVPLSFVKTLRREFDTIYEDCRATLGRTETAANPDAQHKVSVSAEKRASFWFRKSRWRIFPRLTGPMGDPMLLANPFVVPILEDMLGEDFYCKYVTSDTCANGAILQSPHSDIDMGDAFVDNHWRARGYVVNVPVMECGLHNGPIEVWPGGSHLWHSDTMNKHGLAPYVQDGRNPPVERVAEFFPSVKVALQPGEILIRDLAMWHRGTPNPTDEPRTMMTIGYFRGDYVYGYGDPSFNLDQGLYKSLHPRIRRMFDYHFTLPAVLRRKQREIRAQVRSAATSWVNARRKRQTPSQ